MNDEIERSMSRLSHRAISKALATLIAVYLVSVVFGIGFMHGSGLSGICQ